MEEDIAGKHLGHDVLGSLEVEGGDDNLDILDGFFNQFTSETRSSLTN